MKFEYFLPK